MDRRQAIERVALLMGGAVIGTEFFVSGCKSGHTVSDVKDLFNADNTAFLNEVGETILPTTSSPGAKAANVGGFMAIMVRDCYTPDDQKIFMTSFSKIDDATNKKFSKKFLDATPEQRTAVLSDLDKEQKAYSKTKKEKDPNHYFKMVKELTLLGFFTSEVGCTKALRYVPVPGKYIGTIPYKKGDKAWALS
jgi:hypothetical protein